jgi:tetratricopeptide (TPR) repeat protein
MRTLVFAALFLLASPFPTWASGAARAVTAVPHALRAYLAERSGEPEEALDALLQAVEADPESAVLRLEAARLLLGHRRMEEALALVERGVELRPGEPELLLLRARLLEVQGRGEEAAATARQAAAGGSAEARGLAVRLLEALGRKEEALQEAQGWVEAEPRSADAFFTLGRLHLVEGDREKARQALSRALSLDPNHRGGLRALARLEEDASGFTAAEALYRRLVAVNPHDVEARFRLGQTLLRQGRVDEALAVFEAAERWSGGDPGLRFRLGVLLLQEERAQDAEAVFRTMAEAHGADSQAWYLLGVSLLAQKKYAEAVESLDRVPPQAPEYSDALVRKAIALDGLERKAEARALLEARLAEDPADEEVVLALAGLWEDDAEYRRAADLLEGYLQKRETGNARVFFTLGVLHDKLKDWRRSAEYMQRSLELNPDDPHALNYLGYTYAEQGVHLEEAERLILRALELKPGDGFITDSLGWVYYKQGRYPEAVETLRKALEANPEDPIIWEHLGDALVAAGEPGEAAEAYRRTLEIAPDTESARQKLEAL